MEAEVKVRVDEEVVEVEVEAEEDEDGRREAGVVGPGREEGAMYGWRCGIGGEERERGG